MKGKLVRIVAPHFVAGLVTYSSKKRWRYPEATISTRCHICAPIISYMERWSIANIARFCNHKGWKYEFVDFEGGFANGTNPFSRG